MALPRILLLEAQFVLRRTLVAVGRDLGMVAFSEAASPERARSLLQAETFDGVVLDFHDADADRALGLVRELRQGRFVSAPDTQVVVLAAVLPLPPGEARRLQELGVSSVIHRPFKIGQLLDSLRDRQRGGPGQAGAPQTTGCHTARSTG